MATAAGPPPVASISVVDQSSWPVAASSAVATAVVWLVFLSTNTRPPDTIASPSTPGTGALHATASVATLVGVMLFSEALWRVCPALPPGCSQQPESSATMTSAAARTVRRRATADDRPDIVSPRALRMPPRHAAPPRTVDDARLTG
jgi:hypothetical protein